MIALFSFVTQQFQKLKSMLPFRRPDSVDEAMVTKTLQQHFLSVRSADPDTSHQWLRVHRAIVEGEVKGAAMKSHPKQPFTLAPGRVVSMRIAVAMFAILLIGTFAYLTLFPPSYEAFATRNGEQKHVLLDDGTEITLSYATQLVVPHAQAGKPRRVSLTGEALFRVRHSETPFIVSTQYAEIEVLGTEFNLRAREEGLEAAVIEGVVKIRAFKNGETNTLVLTQRQMAICSHDGIPRQVGTIPASEYPGWMYDKLYLHKTALLTASREIEMRFDVSISIKDPRVRSVLITGILDAKTPESAVSALCELVGKRYTYDGQGYTIY
jgi:ferric-dicitrate binding protein FerR (iron transport regulator)